MPFSHFTRNFLSKRPAVAGASYVSKRATLIGAVKLGQDSSVFPGCVLRADINCISIGDCTNIQDRTVIHVTSRLAVEIGDDVSVGHGAIIHGCRIGHGSLVGMGAVLLDGSEIGPESIVAAGSLVSKNKTFPARSLIQGSPARVIRSVTDEEVAQMREAAAKYVIVSKDLLNYEKGEETGGRGV